ncbi:hypothetical protein R9X47_18225 [Wukongibacter baidiensis]|uniref:hypothetical protein n=1 Tax=Wukongibacter baidiensis TaxID=1723361 RepID=UPI003D7F4176
MVYNPTIWKDQIETDPTRYKIRKQDGSEEIVNIERVLGEAIQEGTKITAEKLNNIEQGINDNANEIDVVGTQMIKISNEIEDSLKNVHSNQIDLAIELETLKKATLTGVTANMVVETFMDISDITSLNEALKFDPSNQKIFLA